MNKMIFTKFLLSLCLENVQANPFVGLAFGASTSSWIEKMSPEQWALFTYRQNPCGPLEEPRNGRLSCKLRQGTAFCRVTCADGFEFADNKSRFQWCKNRSWTPKMSASCVPSGVFMPESARSRNVLGSAFLAELKDLFGNEADFSENLECASISNPDNGVNWCDDGFKSGSVCTTICQEGFHISNDSENVTGKRKCQCSNGECRWSEKKDVRCRKNPSCPAITAPENGSVYCPIDDVCLVSCNQGFETEEGLIEETLKCECENMRNSYLCNWNRAVPTCKPKKGCEKECGKNSSCRLGPTGWGCTCNCGFFLRQGRCIQITPRWNKQRCRDGWLMKNQECILEDSSKIGSCSFEKIERRVLKKQQARNDESFLDCSRQDLANVKDITIPGTTNTFIAFNSGMNSTQDLSRAFGNLIDLEVTNIGDNDFDEFSGDLFASNCRLSGVGLGPAKKPPRISPFLFHNNNLLKKVDLGGLQTTIPLLTLSHLSNLEWLSLRENNIPVLTPAVAYGKTQLRYLDLASSRIRAILDGAFGDLENLEFLNLSNNKIKFLTAGQTRGMKKLKFGDFSGNEILEIGGDLFKDSPLIEDVNFSSNHHLSKICRSTFIRLEFLQSVDLRDCSSLPISLQKKFCRKALPECGGSLLAMQRALLDFGEEC